MIRRHLGIFCHVPSFNLMSNYMRHPFQQLYALNQNSLEDDGLVPDLPSWAATLDLETFQPEPRSIPRDVARSDGEIAWDERSIVIDVIDPTSLSTNFDRSCLDSLEDRLLLNPNESFADVCWGTAVYDVPDRAATPTPTQVQIDTGLYTRRDSEDSEDSFSDEDPTTPIFEKELVDSDEFKVTDIYADFLPTFPTFIDNLNDYDDQKSFIVLDPAFSMSNPQESVNYFPVPVRPTRAKLPTRFITFCSKFPARLKSNS